MTQPGYAANKACVILRGAADEGSPSSHTIVTQEDEIPYW